MKYLFVVPARGGSKSIPGKNIYPINGKPLLAYTLDVISDMELNGEAAVSSDSEKILDVARIYPRVTCIKRPSELSGDQASTESVLIHTIEYMYEYYGAAYDAVVTLQPTSPMRRVNTIQSFLKAFEKNINEFDAQLTLSEDRSDFWVRGNDGCYIRLYPNAPRRRQERKPLYVENSCIYVTKVDSLLETGSILGKKANGFVIPYEEGIDINEPVDLLIAEVYCRQPGRA